MILAHFDRAEGGSFGLLLAGIAAEAVSRGWQTEIVVFATEHQRPWLGEIAATGAGVHEAPPSLIKAPRDQADWLASHFRERRPTVIHTHFTTWDLGGLLATGLLGKPHGLFWHVHSALPRNPLIYSRTMIKMAISRRKLSGILCPAPDIAEGIKRRGAPRSRTHVVPSAIDTSRFPLGGPEAKAEARAELGLDPEAFYILHFGWHTYLKGSDRYLQTLAKLPEFEGRPVHGLQRGGFEEMEELATDLGISDRAHEVEPIEDISVLFRAVDVLFQPSRREGMAYTLLEALSSGLPVVATAIPGHRPLDPLDAVRLVEHETDSMADGLREVLGLPADRLAQAGAQARAWVEGEYGIEVQAAAMLDRYEAALQGS